MDALSTLLMVIIFVLLVFVLAQAFLSVALSGRDKQLDRVNRQLAEVSDMLSLERSHEHRPAAVAQPTQSAARGIATRRANSGATADALKSQAERHAGADRDTLRAERDKLAQQLADAGLQAQSSAARVRAVAEAASPPRPNRGHDARVARELAQLATQLADMRKQAADLDKTVQVDKDTIATQALRSGEAGGGEPRADCACATIWRSRRRTQRCAPRPRHSGAQRSKASWPRKRIWVTRQRAQIALLNQQVDQLKAQLTSVCARRSISPKTQGATKDTQIANLGQKLNAALAQKVEELQGYRSEFFGKLRAVLANRPGVQIVGDRFVITERSAVPAGQRRLDPSRPGRDQLPCAVTIKKIAMEIPPDISWILRVDGHTDRQANQVRAVSLLPTGSCRRRAPSPS